MTVSLSPVSDQEDGFLFQVYASTRAGEMALVDWSPEQKTAFLQMQFSAQRQHYRAYYPRATYHVIRRDDAMLGRLIVNRSEDEILLMDIALLPEYRNGGIGTALIRELQNESARTGRPLRLHVETFNPALHLYERLGFVTLRASGIYLEMEWSARAEHEGRASPDSTTISRSE
jgi:ribosomal protein S18 acetylase RimI-like enzyme